MRRMALVLLVGWAVAATAILAASQLASPPEAQILRISTRGPAPSLKIKGTLIYSGRAGNGPGEVSGLIGRTPFEIEVRPDFAFAIIEPEAGLGQLEVSLRPKSGVTPAVFGVGTRVLVGNNLKVVPGEVWIRGY